jgi:hypothetical protein
MLFDMNKTIDVDVMLAFEVDKRPPLLAACELTLHADADSKNLAL